MNIFMLTTAISLAAMKLHPNRICRIEGWIMFVFSVIGWVMIIVTTKN